MAKPVGTKNRSHQVILKHRRDIARYYLKGLTMTEMGRRLKITVPTIKKEIDDIRQVWIRSAMIDFNEAQGEALHKLDMMEQKCLEKFAVSEEKKIITTKKRVPMMKDDDGKLYVDTKGKLIIEQVEPGYVVVEETIRTEGQVGDVRWLAEIRQLLDMRLKILGLYKSSTKESGGPERAVSVAKETTKGKIALLCAIIETGGDFNSGS